MVELPAIEFAGVSKKFVFTPDRPQTVLESLVSGLARRRRPPQPLWAVRDLSFAVSPGQSLGIVGRNGSGKSTVLKLAAGILRPTSGQTHARGRISALLELGAGFHPDLTGRENVFLNGSVLGLSKREVQARFQDIVDFSELEEFIDMPVKHYSSGMYMRLGFSVAVHVDPSILIVDEILAVGDYAFQTRCLDRIRALQERGVTIVMVSHQLKTIRHLCSQAIWMDHGQARASGPVDQVLEQYLDHFQAQPGGATESAAFRRWGTGEVEITGVRFLDDAGTPCATFHTGQPFLVEIGYQAHQPIRQPEFGLAFYSQDNTHISGPNNRQGGLAIEQIEGRGKVQYRLESLPLLPGTYRVTAAIHDTHLPRAFDFHEEAYTFRVQAGPGGEMAGLVTWPAHWHWFPAVSLAS